MTFVLGEHLKQFVKTMVARFGKAAKQLSRANIGDAPPFLSEQQNVLLRRWGFLRVNAPTRGTHYGGPVLIPWAPVVGPRTPPSGNSPSKQ